MTQVLHCPYCDGTDIVRHGTTPEGKQRYRCRACPNRGRTFLLEYTYAGQSPEVKQQIEGVPPFTRGVMGHEIGLALARELRPLGPGHSLPLSSPQRIQWHVCGGRRGQDGCDRADAV